MEMIELVLTLADDVSLLVVRQEMCILIITVLSYLCICNPSIYLFLLLKCLSISLAMYVCI